MTTKQYLINKLATELSLKSGYINIRPYGFEPIQSWDLDDETVKYALSRSWAEVSNIEPPVTQSPKGVEIEVTKPFEGLTFEELQAELAEKAAKTAEAEQAKLDAADAKDPAPEPVVIEEIPAPVPTPEVEAPAPKTKKSK
jgi:hypothetical protein